MDMISSFHEILRNTFLFPVDDTVNKLGVLQYSLLLAIHLRCALHSAPELYFHKTLLQN